MKRFIGLILSVAGGAVTLWGGYCVLTGTSNTRVTLADDISVSALTAGLVGVATFTVGLIWIRD